MYVGNRWRTKAAIPATWGAAWLVPQKPRWRWFRGLSAVSPQSRSYDVGLDPAVGRWPPAAVRFYRINVVPGGRAHCQHARVRAFRRIGDTAAPGVVLDRINCPNRQLNPVGHVAAVMDYNYAKIIAVNPGPKEKRFKWHMTALSRLFILAVIRRESARGYMVQVKVQICTGSIPVVFPPQLDPITPARSQGQTINFVIPADKINKLIVVRVRVASKPGLLSFIPR